MMPLTTKALSAMVKNTEKRNTDIQVSHIRPFNCPWYYRLHEPGKYLITSIITRKRELGILQAIDPTKQVIGCLDLKGFVSIAGTLAVSLTLGNLLGYLIP